MRTIAFLFILLFVLSKCTYGQVSTISVGIDGLHCSACSFGTEKSLRQLDFVQDIKMDLNAHIAEITIKPDKKVDFDAIVQKVLDAWFSVRSVYVVYSFVNLSVSNNTCYDDKNFIFSFISVKDLVLNGPQALHLVGKNFMPRSEFKKWKNLLNNTCNNSDPKSRKVYQVTL